MQAVKRFKFLPPPEAIDRTMGQSLIAQVRLAFMAKDSLAARMASLRDLARTTALLVIVLEPPYQ